MSVVTTGVPPASASTSTVGSPSRSPEPSIRHGRARTAQRRSASSTRDDGCGPRKSTRSPIPSRIACACNCSCSGPPPISSSRSAGRSDPSWANASSRQSTPFFGTSRQTHRIGPYDAGARAGRSARALRTRWIGTPGSTVRRWSALCSDTVTTAATPRSRPASSGALSWWKTSLACAVTVTGTPASAPASRATSAAAVAKCAWTCRTPSRRTRSATRPAWTNRRQVPARRALPASRSHVAGARAATRRWAPATARSPRCGCLGSQRTRARNPASSGCRGSSSGGSRASTSSVSPAVSRASNSRRMKVSDSRGKRLRT